MLSKGCTLEASLPERCDRQAAMTLHDLLLVVLVLVSAFAIAGVVFYIANRRP